MPDDADRSTSERRRAQREPITLVVDYDGIDDFLGDYTENLSTGGTYVNTARGFEVGTEVRLVLSFPGLLRPIALDGVVRWTRDEGDERGVGIEFPNYDEVAKSTLVPIIEGIRKHDPSYVSRIVKVLVVEDNPHVSQLIREGLCGGSNRDFGETVTFSFRTAANGRDALALLERESFEAAIIDVYLPILDGLSVIARMRENERFREVPIIAVSAGGDTAREAALSAGADFFIDKPMRLRQIIDTMKRLIIAGR